MNKKFANTKKFRANKKLKQKNSRRISKQKNSRRISKQKNSRRISKQKIIINKKIKRKSRRKINTKNNKAGNVTSRVTSTLKSIQPLKHIKYLKIIPEKKYVTMSPEELKDNLIMLVEELDNCEKQKLEMYNFIKGNMEFSKSFTDNDIIDLMQAVTEAMHFNKIGNPKKKEELNNVYKALFKKLEKHRQDI